MPSTYIALPPTTLRIVGGNRLIEGVEIGLTGEDRILIAARASDELLEEWARVARQTAPTRSGRLARSIRAIPRRGLEVAFYGGYQHPTSQRLPWLTQAWQTALGSTPRAVRRATQEVRPEFNFSLSDTIQTVQDFAATPVGTFVVERIQTRALSLVVALALVRIGG